MGFGFGKKSRREAKQAQEASMRQQQQLFEQTQSMFRDYQAGFDKRNAGIMALQSRAQKWLDDYDRGVDVAKLNPALAKTLMDSANITTRTMQVANQVGNRAMVQGDKGFQQKLNSLAQRQMYRDMASLNEQGLMAERANQTGIMMDTSNFLNSDRMAGMNLQGNLFGMGNSLVGMYTNKYNQEVARSNAMFNNMMGLISGGVGAFTSIAGLPMFRGGGGSGPSGGPR